MADLISFPWENENISRMKRKPKVKQKVIIYMQSLLGTNSHHELHDENGIVMIGPFPRKAADWGDDHLKMARYCKKFYNSRTDSKFRRSQVKKHPMQMKKRPKKKVEKEPKGVQLRRKPKAPRSISVKRESDHFDDQPEDLGIESFGGAPLPSNRPDVEICDKCGKEHKGSMCTYISLSDSDSPTYLHGHQYYTRKPDERVIPKTFDQLKEERKYREIQTMQKLREKQEVKYVKTVPPSSQSIEEHNVKVEQVQKDNRGYSVPISGYMPRGGFTESRKPCPTPGCSRTIFSEGGTWECTTMHCSSCMSWFCWWCGEIKMKNSNGLTEPRHMRCRNGKISIQQWVKKYSEEQDFEVSQILQKRVNPASGMREFLVRWKGYSARESTWEPESNLEGCKEKLDEFLDSQAIESNAI